MLYTQGIEHVPGAHGINRIDEKAAIEKEVKAWLCVATESVRWETQAPCNNSKRATNNMYAVECGKHKQWHHIT